MSFPGPTAAAYDRAITMFSPEGRLYQVLYASEAVRQGWTSLGLRTDSFVVLAAEKRRFSRLLDLEEMEKIYKIDDHIGATFAGIGGDGRVLIDYIRLAAIRHRLVYGEAAGIEYIVRAVADLKQAYTQHGGVRPFGVSLIIGGVEDGKTRLFRTEPGGQYFGFYAVAVGMGEEAVMGVFEKKYRRDMNLEEALDLVAEAILRARFAVTKEKKEEVLQEAGNLMEIAVIEAERPLFRKLSPDEVKEVVDRVAPSLG
ncbi:MAG: archaeal proteasome endopeptidase complex subunit alpha [Desulfurococcales archaeon]|nr:archaeal proteasome endopeptidase complex subunit alpha [Desulfurococcales archaeon]